MIGWLIPVAIAALALAALYASGRCDRQALELALAALLIGLAGYAWHGQPGMPGQPNHPAPVVALESGPAAR